MRVAVVGVGAIGTTISVALLEAGRDVLVCSRRQLPRLRVTGSPGRRSAEPRSHVDPQSVSVADVVIVSTKAHQVAGAAAWLRALCDASSLVVVVQNGVEHERWVRPWLDRQTVVPALALFSADATALGEVLVRSEPRLLVPEGAHMGTLRAIFSGCFVSLESQPDWATTLWRKLLVNAAFGAIALLTNRSLRVLDDAGAADLALALMCEAARVGRAEGALLPEGSERELMLAALERARDHVPSILQSRRGGSPTEWRARHEVIVRFGQRHGIDTPLHQMLTTLIRLGEPEALDSNPGGSLAIRQTC